MTTRNDVPLPDGATDVDDWTDVGHPDQFRLFSGPTRPLAGLTMNDGSPGLVAISGVQLRDGTIESRCIRVGGFHWDDELDADTVRGLARSLLDAADDLDRLQRS